MALSVEGGREITRAKKRVRLPPSISRVSICRPPVQGWAFQFFPPSNKINPLRAIDQINFRTWQPRYAALTITNFPPRKEDPPTRTPPLPAAKFHAVQLAANHSTWPIYYPTIVTGLIRRLIRPRPRNYGLFNRGFSSGMHDFTIGRRFENTEQYIELSKDTKGFETKSGKFDFSKSANPYRCSSPMFLYYIVTFDLSKITLYIN